MKARVPVCILGAGPAGLLAHAFLRARGCDPAIVAQSALGNLQPMQHDGLRVGIVPIFPPEDSDLFRRMAWKPAGSSDIVTVSYVQGEEGPPGAISPGSHADFLVQSFSDIRRRLVLASKHAGEGVFQRGYPELRRKVASTYPQARRPRNYVGFCEGVSYYLRYIERAGLGALPVEQILGIDVAGRRVVTESREIGYEQLVCTLPITDFLRMATLRTNLEFVGTGAQLAVGVADGPVDCNHMVYDCDALSPVFRAFVPRSGFIVAQVAQGHWRSDPGPIAGRLQQLFGLEAAPRLVRRLDIGNCYPLAVSNGAERDRLVRELEDSGITLFGRGAQWQYLDLDELDWRRIDRLH